jgi:hypothetical protein
MDLVCWFCFLHLISTPFSVSFRSVHTLSTFLLYIFLLFPIDKILISGVYMATLHLHTLSIDRLALSNGPKPKIPEDGNISSFPLCSVVFFFSGIFDNG